MMEDNNNDMADNETSSDVKVFSRAKGRGTTPIRPEFDEETGNQIPQHVLYDNYGDYYDMSGDKYLIIFNQHRFKKTMYFNNQKYNDRRGTDEDVKSLEETFGALGFNVSSYTDLEYEEIMDKVDEFCKGDHKTTSCVAVAVLTHGERGGEVCAADRPYPLTTIITMLQHNKALAGKPKLVFVQACRGTKVDEGHKIQLDGDEISIVIPTHADCLVLYSSHEDYVSYRDSEGSWLIQALCNVISENKQTLDILQMITLVHRKVAFRFAYMPHMGDMHNKKQMPEARFTLTKFLKFS